MMMDDEMTLQEYVEAMLARHERLSLRQASLEAGLSSSSVSNLLRRKDPKPDPRTLKKLADRWGTFEDYQELMRLAGHPVPDREPIGTEGLERIAAVVGVSVSDLERIAKGEPLEEGSIQHVPQDRPSFKELLAAVEALPEDVLERILDFALWERERWMKKD
jgi:transcriptional regulator with XRE-family HTH domain